MNTVGIRHYAAGALFLAAFAGVVAYAQSRQESSTVAALRKELVAERACEKSPVCLDNRALMASYDQEHPAQSRTGRAFFQGVVCEAGCKDLLQGYAWANQAGVTRREGCNNPSFEFVKGCLLVVEPGDRYYGEDYGREPYPD